MHTKKIRRVGVGAYRIATCLALAGVFVLVWMNGAVGIIGSENNPANLLYGGVLITLFLGSIIARLKPLGMSRVLFATALVQALVPVAAFLIWRPDFGLGVVQVFILNAFFVALFAISGFFFRHAATDATKRRDGGF